MAPPVLIVSVVNMESVLAQCVHVTKDGQVCIKVILWQFNYKIHFLVVWTLPLGLP